MAFKHAVHTYPLFHASLGLNSNPTSPPASSTTVPDSTRTVKRILRKRSSERLLAADFLAADKTVDRNGDCTVDVACVAVLAEAHFGKGFADTEDGFEMADL